MNDLEKKVREFYYQDFLHCALNKIDIFKIETNDLEVNFYKEKKSLNPFDHDFGSFVDDVDNYGDEDDSVYGFVRRNFKSIHKYESDEHLLEIYKQIEEKIFDLHEKGFFNDLLDLKIKRTLALFKAFENIPEKFLKKNKIFEKYKNLFTIDNLSKNHNNNYVQYFVDDVFSLNKVSHTLIKESYPLSYKKIEKVLVTQNLENTKIYNFEADLYADKFNEFEKILNNEIFINLKPDDIEEVRRKAINKISKVIFDNEYNYVDLKNYVFESNIFNLMKNNDCDKILKFLKKSNNKIKEVAEIIYHISNICNNVEYFKNLLSHMVNQKEYLLSLELLSKFPVAYSETQEYFANKIAEEIIKDNIEFEVLINNPFMNKFLDILKTKRFYNNREKMYEIFNSNEDLDFIKNIDSKSISLELNKLQFFLDKPYSNKEILKRFNIIDLKKQGFSLNLIDNIVRVDCIFENASKLSEKEILTYVVKILENSATPDNMIINIMDEMKLNAKLKTINKSSILNGNKRWKI